MSASLAQYNIVVQIHDDLQNTPIGSEAPHHHFVFILLVGGNGSVGLVAGLV
jgi:hypothetical protein